MIITGLIELKDIKGEYDIVDIKENVRIWKLRGFYE